MSDANILDKLIEPKLLAVLKYFIDNPDKQFYLREIARKTKVPAATTYRILKELKELNIIEELRIKNFKLYQLKDNRHTDFLDDIISTKKSALDEFVEFIKDIPGIVQVLLHGKETADKASLLIVGHDIVPDKIQKAVLEIKDKYKYDILYLTLEPAQFEQMMNMGLYPGKKVTLLKKE